jgi:hypothetical protein
MFGGSTKVRFVRTQEIEHCPKDRRIAETRAQGISRHPGQGQ